MAKAMIADSLFLRKKIVIDANDDKRVSCMNQVVMNTQPGPIKKSIEGQLFPPFCE
jgi:hypothetical protein